MYNPCLIMAMNVYFILVIYLFIPEVMGQCPVHCKAGQICKNTDARCEECEEGYWGHQCQHAVACERPKLKNNSYISNSTDQSVYIYKDIITIYCIAGYGTLGKSTLWCRGNRAWSSSPPLCLEYTCTRPTLPNVYTLIENPKEAYVVGEQMRLVCRPKRVIEGNKTVSCLPDGSWGKTLPACTEENGGSFLLIVILVSASVLYIFTALTMLLCCRMRRQQQENKSKQRQEERTRRRKTNTSVRRNNKTSENSPINQVSTIEIYVGWKHEDKNHLEITRKELTKVLIDKTLKLKELKQWIINQFPELVDQNLNLNHVRCQTASGNFLPDSKREMTVDQYLKENGSQQAEFYLHTKEKRRGYIQLDGMENDEESSTDVLNTMATNDNRQVIRLPRETRQRLGNGDHESRYGVGTSSSDVSDRPIWTVDQRHRQMATNDSRQVIRLPGETRQRLGNGDDESRYGVGTNSSDVSDRPIWTVDQRHRQMATNGSRQVIRLPRETRQRLDNGNDESRYGVGTSSSGVSDRPIWTVDQRHRQMATNDSRQVIRLPGETRQRLGNGDDESRYGVGTSISDASDRPIWTVDQIYRQMNERRLIGGMTYSARNIDNENINTTGESYELSAVLIPCPESRYHFGGPIRHSPRVTIINGNAELQPVRINQESYRVPSDAYDDGRNTTSLENISRRTTSGGPNQSSPPANVSTGQSLHTFLDETTNSPSDNTYSSDTCNHIHETGRSSLGRPRSINLGDEIIQNYNATSDIPSNSDTTQPLCENTTDLAALERQRQITTNFENEREQSPPLHYSVLRQVSAGSANYTRVQESNDAHFSTQSLRVPDNNGCHLASAYNTEQEISIPSILTRQSTIQSNNREEINISNGSRSVEGTNELSFENTDVEDDSIRDDSSSDILNSSFDSESDDPNIQAAIHDSYNNTRSETSSDELLRNWIEITRNDRDYSMPAFTIDRTQFLNSALDVLKRPNFDFKKKFTVKFSGERGSDFGGLKREFLSCLMKEMASAILEGGDSKMCFIHSIAKVESKLFYHAAISIALSLLHGGPGLPVLNKSVYKLMLNQTVTLTLDDVVDIDVRDKIRMFRDNTDNSTNSLDDWLIEQGLEPPFTANKRPSMTQHLLKNHLYFRVHKEITDFKEGLRFVGLLPIMEKNPEEMADFFTSKNEKLSFQKLKDVYQVSFSPRSDDNRIGEDETMDCFESFLRHCDSKTSDVSLDDVLFFWTGSRCIPPLGFDRIPTITFIPDNNSRNWLPVAHTCGLILDLPRGITDLSRMTHAMTTAVQFGGGFYCV